MIQLNALEIEESVNCNEMIKAMEKAFIHQAKGNFTMPPRIHLKDQGNVHLLMPCFSGKYYCTKLVSVHPANTLLNLPLIQGKVLLNDRQNGNVLAILDAAKITALRTGAVGAVGVKFLSSPKAKSIGLIGNGIQGLSLLRMICTIRDVQEINLFDYKSEATKSFVLGLEAELNNPEIKINIHSEKKSLLEASEIIVLASSSSNPVLPDIPQLLKEKCFIGMGSYKKQMQEFPNALFPLLEQYYIDTWQAKKESGDVLNPLDKGLLSEKAVFELSDLISGKEKLQGKTTAFKSVGMALFDLFAAAMIYEKKMGLNP